MTVDYNIWWTGIGVFATSILLLLLLGVKVFQADLPLFFRQWQWRLQGRAYPDIARVFLDTIYHDLSERTARAHVYRVRRSDEAHGHGLWRSRVNLESVGARSVHTQARVPRCLLCLRSWKGTVQSLMMHWVNFRLLGGGGNTIPCNWKEIYRGYKLSDTCVQHSKCTCT